MGKITINEIHKSLFGYIQAVSDESLETKDKTIVGAINELIQNSNSNKTEINNLTNEISNGKQLIANAIGTPLSSNDTFSAMSNKINTMKNDLKQVLTDEGVTVTTGDTMSSLITKVDEEFERKNANSGLDIISATELPNEVVNNQVCLITESFGKVYIANELSTAVLNEGDVYIKTTTAYYYATTHIITPMNDISLNLSRIVQIKNGTEEKIDGYVGIDGQWVPTDSLEFYLFKEGTGLHPSVGGFNTIESDGKYSVSNNSISLTGYADFGNITIQSKNKIDLTEYSKLEVKSSDSGYGSFTLSVGGNVLYLSDNASEPAVLDISAINGLYNIEIKKGANYQNQSGTIYYIKLIKEFK